MMNSHGGRLSRLSDSSQGISEHRTSAELCDLVDVIDFGSELQKNFYRTIRGASQLPRDETVPPLESITTALTEGPATLIPFFQQQVGLSKSNAREKRSSELNRLSHWWQTVLLRRATDDCCMTTGGHGYRRNSLAQRTCPVNLQREGVSVRVGEFQEFSSLE